MSAQPTLIDVERVATVKVQPRRRSRRETVPPGGLRTCGVCKGRGAPKYAYEGTKSFVIYAYDWESRSQPVGTPLYKPVRVYIRAVLCWACKGSGLNATPERARELELLTLEGRDVTGT